MSDKDKDGKENGDHAQLSLFEDIISDVKPGLTPTTDAIVERNEEGATNEIDPVLAALTKKEWDTLSLLTENGADAVQKLLWVIAQSKLKIMPSAVLCAPLEESLAKIKSTELDPAIRANATDVTFEIAEKLLESDERDLALSLLTVASKNLDGTKIRERLVSILSDDVSLAPTKESLLSPDEMQKRLQLLDLKRSLVARDSGAFELGLDKAGDTSAVERGSQGTSHYKSTGLVQGSAGRLPLIIFALLCCLGLLWFAFWYQSSEPGLASARVQVQEGLKLEAKLPEVSPIPPPSRLDSIMYDSRLVPTAAPDTKEADGVVSNPTVGASSPISIEATIPAPSPKPSGSPIAKEALKLDGPYESNKIEKILGGKSFAGSSYDDILPDERDFLRKPIEERSRERPSREIATDSRDRDRDRASDSRDAPRDGDNLYEVRINTTVMDRPSFKGRTVADLYVGDRVMVEARVGKWFRILSQKGAPGYVMGQDVEKID